MKRKLEAEVAKRKEQEQSSLWVQNQTLHQWGPSIKNKLQQTEEEKILLQQRTISARDKPDSSQTQNETTQQSSQEKESNIIKPDNSQAQKRHSREICKKNMKRRPALTEAQNENMTEEKP